MTGLRRMREYIRASAALGPTWPDRWSLFWRQTRNLRVRLGAGRHRPSDVFRLRTTVGPLYFRDNFGDITNVAGVVFRNVYRARPLARDGAIVDVGANIGLAAACFAHFNPGRAVHCVEPLTANAALIARNCPSATVDVCAVGRTEGTVGLHVDPDEVIASSIPCRWETRTVVVPVRTLDDIARARGIDRVALLKIDAEGMEPDILRGASRLLAVTAETAIETHGATGHGETRALLRAAGFAVVSDTRDGDTGFLIAERP